MNKIALTVHELRYQPRRHSSLLTAKAAHLPSKLNLLNEPVKANALFKNIFALIIIIDKNRIMELR